MLRRLWIKHRTVFMVTAAALRQKPTVTCWAKTLKKGLVLGINQGFARGGIRKGNESHQNLQRAIRVPMQDEYPKAWSTSGGSPGQGGLLLKTQNTQEPSVNQWWYDLLYLSQIMWTRGSNPQDPKHPRTTTYISDDMTWLTTAGSPCWDGLILRT